MFRQHALVWAVCVCDVSATTANFIIIKVISEDFLYKYTGTSIHLHRNCCGIHQCCVACPDDISWDGHICATICCSLWCCKSAKRLLWSKGSI